MDDSLSSTNYMAKSLPSRTDDDNSSQDSGWTLYFVDLIANSFDDDEGSSLSSGCQTSSMAPSGLRKDDDGDSEHITASSLSLRRCRNRLISKRRKAKASFVDQDLEDTATSPVRSPKVTDFSCMYMKSQEVDEKEVFQENENDSQKTIEEGIGMGFQETDLRRKGFCLVPMSMLLC